LLGWSEIWSRTREGEEGGKFESIARLENYKAVCLIYGFGIT